MKRIFDVTKDKELLKKIYEGKYCKDCSRGCENKKKRKYTIYCFPRGVYMNEYESCTSFNKKETTNNN